MSGGIGRDPIGVAREALSSFHSRSAELTNRDGPSAQTPSPFADDVAAFSRSESVHTVYGQSMTLIEIAADHVTAFLKLISEPCETIAPWTCSRTLLDVASLAVWIVEPGLDVRERIGRSLALRYEGLSQRLKWARAASTDDTRINPQLAVERIAHVTAEAGKVGFDPVLDRNDRQVGIGTRMPSVTERVRTMLDQEDTYRLLSAIAHGHFWAARQAGFDVSGTKEKKPDGARVAHMTKAVNAAGMFYLATAIAAAFGKATWCHARYAGWKHHDVEDLLSQLFDRLAITEEHRFWLAAS